VPRHLRRGVRALGLRALQTDRTAVPTPQPGGSASNPARPERRATRTRAAGARCALALVLLGGAVEASAATYYVDGASPSASDSNPGTASLPYKTISAAVKARAGAGNTIVVEPATYREEVTVPAAGASGSPFAIQAAAAGTIVDGGDDFSSTSKWTPVSGNVYRTPVNWTPKQVFSDGARLTPSSALRPPPLAFDTYYPGME